MENKRVFAGGLIAGAVLTLAVGGCAFVGVTLYQGTKNGSSLEEVGNKTTMEKVNVLEGMIDNYYLEDVSAEDLEQGVYKGLLDALGDPYSVYYTADELETLQEKKAIDGTLKLSPNPSKKTRRKGFVGYRNAASEDCKRNFRNAGGGSRTDGKRPFV